MIWYKDNTDDIVISTRIRLARNIAGVAFPNALSDKTKIRNAIKDALTKRAGVLSDTFSYILLDDISNLEKSKLAEEHLISSEMLEGEGKAVLISEDKNISVLLMEEDHMRLQVIKPGLCLEEAYDLADKIDDLAEESLDFAFDEQWGYLTACPTNTGTGMRASVMMHLGALTLTNNIQKVISSAQNLGITVRGLYGEGSKSFGCMYQISNRATQGHTEKEIIQSLSNIVNRIAELEKSARESLSKNNEDEISDRVYRAYGTLKYARKLTSSEAKALLSDVLLGKNMGIIKETGKKAVTELMVLGEPAMLCDTEEILPDERDKKRAELIRQNI